MACSRRKWMLRSLGTAFVLLLSACATPTLPLPPPSALADAPGGDGLAAVRGDALALSFVSCINPRLDRGVIVRAGEDGRFELEIEAVAGDSLILFISIDTDTGPPIEILVPDS